MENLSCSLRICYDINVKNYQDNLATWDPKVIARGKAYFDEGKVGKIHHEGNRFWAQIKGSKSYLVTLEFDEHKNLTYAFCNCPVPAHCKHEAALCCALDAAREEKEINSTSLVDTFYHRLENAVQGKNLDAFTTLSYALAGLSPLVSPEVSLSCFERYFLALFQEESFHADARTFETCYAPLVSRISLGDEQKPSLIASWDESLQNDIPAHDRMVLSLLGSSAFSMAMQQFLCAHDTPSNRSALLSFRGRDIPGTMLPAFVLLLSTQRPHEIPVSSIENAIQEYKLHEQPEKVLTLLRLLLTNGAYASIQEEDFQYLRSVGLSLDARDLAENVFKQTDRFEDYLRLRSFYETEDFASEALRIAPFLSGKSYVGTVLVFDGERYYPRLNSRVTVKHYDWHDLYEARSFIADHKTKETLRNEAVQFVHAELKKKRRDPSYFDALLFLSFYEDPEVAYYWSLPVVQEDAKNPAERAIWFWLGQKVGRLIEMGCHPYSEGKHVSR